MRQRGPSPPRRRIDDAPGSAADASADSDAGLALRDLAAQLQAAADAGASPEHARTLLAQAAEALRRADADGARAQQRWRTLFDAIPDPTSIIAPDGTVLDLNRAGLAAYGRPREQVVGAPIHVINPDLPRDHMVPVLEAMQRGASYLIEVTNMRADGSRFPAEVHTARFDCDGRDVLLAIARDLSDRYTARSQFQELFHAIDQGVIVQDADGQLVEANPAALRILGVPEGMDFAGYLMDRAWTILDADGRRSSRRHLPNSRTIADGRAIEGEVVGLHHSGQHGLRWLRVTTVPVFGPGSTAPQRVLTVFSDITDLKRDSRLFGRSQALAHIGGFEWEVGPNALFLTGEARRILGLVQDPARMDDLVNKLHPRDRGRLQGALQRCLDGEGPLELELMGRRTGNTPYWVRLIGAIDRYGSEAAVLSGTVQDISARKFAEESLRIQARTDALTGVLNRQALLDELAVGLLPPNPRQLAVLYLDLDRFKLVNDALGHAAGDRLLVEAAQRIRDAVGDEGQIGRIGGDEFLVLCDCGDDDSRPERLAQAIIDAFHDYFDLDTDQFSVSTSIGIARAPQDGTTLQDLLQNADAALYESKRKLVGAWQAFTPALAKSQQDRLHLETLLRQALENEEFHLVYQPQVDMRRRRIVAAEALIRWRSDQLGEVQPNQFIAHAEGSGDIVRLGQWVLRSACRQVAAWRDGGHGLVRVAVNVSYRQFAVDNLAERVRQILAEHDLPGAALELEFTERVLIEDAPAALKSFAELREMGVMLTIDDFGEGYSALNYLRRLPIHGLKLSQLFVAGVPQNRSDVAVCEAVAGIARSLGLGLVAEGVETEAQRAFLLRLGVPIGQGYLFSPGLEPNELARRLDGEREPAHGR